MKIIIIIIMNRPGLIVFFHSVSQLGKLIKGLSSVCLAQFLLGEPLKLKHTSFNSFFPKGQVECSSNSISFKNICRDREKVCFSVN